MKHTRIEARNAGILILPFTNRFVESGDFMITVLTITVGFSHCSVSGNFSLKNDFTFGFPVRFLCLARFLLPRSGSETV